MGASDPKGERRQWPGLRLVLCFVLLPWLPAVALLFVPAGDLPVVRDRIVVIVLAGIGAVLASAAIGPTAGRARAVACAVATAVLAVAGVVLTIAVELAIACGDGRASC